MIKPDSPYLFDRGEEHEWRTDYHHMYLYGKDKRVTLIARDGVYSAPIAGEMLDLDESLERILVYYAIGREDFTSFIEDVRANYPAATPVDLQRYYDDFMHIHTVEDSPEIKLEEIPVYAHDGRGLYIVNAGVNVTISAKDEKEIMDLLLTNPPRRANVFEKIVDWFYDYCKKFSLSYAPELSGNLPKDLATYFLLAHGINPESIMQLRRYVTPEEAAAIGQTKEKEKEQLRKSNVKSALFGVGFLVVVVLAIWGLMSLGDNLMSHSNSTSAFLIGGFILLLGFALFSLVLNGFHSPDK